MFTFDEAKARISDLVDDFDRKIDIIKKSGTYKEANVEDEYIKPLFKYLNWNISNEGIGNIADREFIVQAKGKGGKEPDYLLQLNGKPCFYMEAKHPRFDLFKQTKYIWQAYSYAYSTQASTERKKVDFALLTDFEEFRFFDCTFKTDPHLVNNFAVLDWSYKDFCDNFKDLWDVFEREQVVKGSLKRLYINEKKIKQNRIPPDKAFLTDLDDEKTGWRILLAKDIKKYNPELSAEFITKVIQLIIDRFVFIKVLTDREIEDDFLAQVIEQVDRAALKSDEGALNESCREIFARMNKTYNGSVFEPRPELDGVKLGNKTLHSILKDLLPENSRYNFNVIPVEILGTIYEQFLGKVVTTTEKRASIDYKPEVRKAGGVYYTPQYIVDYIVENTVGEKLKSCKTVDDMLAIKICDPACGSGSFLLGAYDRLIRWTVDYYFKKYSTGSPVSKKDMELVYRDSGGAVRLSGKLKREILKSCIYGVDIDEQAAEVTRMSLSLKALEDTRHDELYSEVNLFHETVLPDLKGNVKCGNSLIGTDYFAGKVLPDDEEMRRVNPFDWVHGFPEIMKVEGFDCIIGNPPYIRIQTMKEWAPLEVEIYKELYRSAQSGNYDIYVVFVEKALSLLNKKGTMGFILPHKFFNSQYGASIREVVSKGRHLRHVVHFGDAQVFSGATTYTCLMFLDKEKTDACDFVRVSDLELWSESVMNTESKNVNEKQPYIAGAINADKISGSEWNFTVGEGAGLFEKLSNMPVKLANMAEKIAQGIRTSANEVYVLDTVSTEGEQIVSYSKQLDKKISIEKNAISSFLQGREIKPYHIKSSSKVVIIPYRKEQSKTELIPESEIKNEFPFTYSYLLENKKYLENREHGRMKGDKWYAYVYPKNIEIMKSIKILVPDIADRASFAFDESGMYSFTSGYAIILKEPTEKNYKYILGLLNSKVLDYFLKKISTTMRGGFFRYFTQYVEQLPIRTIDFSNPSEKEKHDRMVSLVEQMLELHKKKASVKDAAETERLDRLITSVDAEIDRLVYDLYDLTEDEIRIVEGA